MSFKAIRKVVKDSSFENVKKIFSESYKNIRIRELKSKPDLYLLTVYDDTAETDYDDICTEANGLILEKNTNKIISVCQPRMKQFIEEDPTDQYNYLTELGQIYKQVSAEFLEDGTVVRLYNYDGEWTTATSKCIDANFSYWSSKKTFNQMFFEVMDKKELKLLDENYTYFFILNHVENRIVIKHTLSHLVFSCRIHNESFLIDKDFSCVEHVSKAIPAKVFDIDDYFKEEEIVSLEEYSNESFRGLVFMFGSSSSGDYCIVNYDFFHYNVVKYARGNTQNINLRCLELLLAEDYYNLNILCDQFSQAKVVSQFVHQCLDNLIEEIYVLYLDTHVKHKFKITEENRLFRTLKQLHGQYKKFEIPIQKSDVQIKIMGYNPRLVAKLLGWVA